MWQFASKASKEIALKVNHHYTSNKWATSDKHSCKLILQRATPAANTPACSKHLHGGEGLLVYLAGKAVPVCVYLCLCVCLSLYVFLMRRKTFFLQVLDLSQVTPRTGVVLPSRQFSSSSSPDTPRTRVVLPSRQFSSSSSPDTPAYSSCTTKSPVLIFQLARYSAH